MACNRQVRVHRVERRWCTAHGQSVGPIENTMWRLSKNEPFIAWCIGSDALRRSYPLHFAWEGRVGYYLGTQWAHKRLWDIELGEEFVFPSSDCVTNPRWNIRTWYERRLRRRLRERYSPEEWYLLDIVRLFDPLHDALSTEWELDLSSDSDYSSDDGDDNDTWSDWWSECSADASNVLTERAAHNGLLRHLSCAAA